MILDLPPKDNFLITLVQTFYTKYKSSIILRKHNFRNTNKIGLELFDPETNATATFKDPNLTAILKMLLEKTSLIETQYDILKKYLNVDNDISVSVINVNKN